MARRRDHDATRDSGLIAGRLRINAKSRRRRRSITPPTVTTTVNPQGSAGTTQTVQIDVSTNPFLRTLDVNFVGQALRPQIPVYYFFDDVNVSGYVQRASVLTLTAPNINFNDVLGNSDKITYLTNSATVLDCTMNPDIGLTQLYLANVIGNFPVGITVTGSKSGVTGVVGAYEHRHGTANTYGGTVLAGGANSITLANDSSTVASYYVGNTIFLCGGLGAGQSGTIAQYNAVTRVVNVASAWTTVPAANTKYSIGTHVVERNGSVAGNFVIPNTSALKFRAGERIFRVIDRVDNSVDLASARADFRWLGTGLTEIKHDIVIQHPQQPAPPPPAPVTPTPTPKPKRIDPVAETFFVDEAVYPGGVFATSVDLFFSTKDAVLPVIVQLRPVVNGFPHSSIVLKGAEATLYPSQINTSATPNTANVATATTFTFPTPVFLDPGTEYALVVLTTSLNYNIFVSELGKTIIGTNRIVSTQPYTGSFFKSQNGSTWTPVQEEDLMFVLRKAVFTPGVTGTIDLHAQAPTASMNVDSLYIQTSEDSYANTTLGYSFSKDSGATYSNITPKETYDQGTRFTVGTTTDGVFRVRGSVSTSDRNISPVLHTEKFLFVGSENIINDLPLTNAMVTIVNGGAGYTVNTTISVIISGGGGTGANAKVDQITGGAIQSILMDNPGSGYTGQANIAFVGGGFTVAANAIFASETRNEGGPAVARYITRVVTLAEGFDAGDIRAYVTAFKPQTTDILLYYKIRNSLDPEPFAAKNWTLMSQKTSATLFSDDDTDPVEYEYRASSNTASVQYTTGTTTYDRFNQFAIKIVLRASSTTVTPFVFDLRAIALPPSGI